MKTPKHIEERVEELLDEHLHKLIVQPSGGDECPHCKCSGTPMTDGSFSPALAYTDVGEVKKMLTKALTEDVAPS